MYSSISSFKLPTPWKEILLSRPVWMNILVQWGNIWGLFTLLTQAPTYFKVIHGWDIRMVSNIWSVTCQCFLSKISHTAAYSIKYDPDANVPELLDV